VLVLREAKTYEEGTNIGKWGLPGGRLELGESYPDGLRREMKEETGLDITPGELLAVEEWRPTIKGVPHQIIAIFSVCRAKSLDVKLSEEHDRYRWIDMDDMEGIMWPEVDVLKRFFTR
jgi:8-oxo-dGTP diphosphatase